MGPMDVEIQKSREIHIVPQIQIGERGRVGEVQNSVAPDLPDCGRQPTSAPEDLQEAERVALTARVVGRLQGCGGRSLGAPSR